MIQPTLITNRYEIGDLIGQGSMGMVYKGVDRISGEPVAIKVLRNDLVNKNPDNLRRFKQEGEALRQLNHPNIVQMQAMISEADHHYLVMDYVGGGSLGDLIHQQEQVSIERTLRIGLELADALTRAHHLNIIHRDLKPANVLLAEDGSPRLTDFGVARIGASSHTETGTVLGTLSYLSPEACNGQELDRRADIWAFGVIIFEMLTGVRPFEGEHMAAVLMAILSQPAPDLEKLRPDIPIELVDLIYRMLSKDRAGRISSMRLVGAELEAILQMMGVDAAEETVWKKLDDGSADLPERRFATPTDSSDSMRHNLPAQTTPFIGRQYELAEAIRLLDNRDVRLVTIVAPGGMGKTRLALEAGRALLGDFTHGVFFISLAPITSSAEIIPTMADALGYQFQQDGRDPKQQVLDYLRDKNMLLIFDNCEHVLDGAQIISDMLHSASGLKALATSRERLNLQDETLLRVEGMGIPDSKAPAADAREHNAVQLFLQGAQRALPGFQLSDVDVPQVTRICKLVQSMPLGILLAAAWVEMLTVKEIANEIERSIDFLETEMRDMPVRHRSIRAVFDYSWKMLSEDERTIFSKMSVFRGGFTRDAAQVVTSASLRTLTGLVNKSLLRRDPDTGRYEVHELLRQYAHEQAASVLAEAESAHVSYYAQWMKDRELDLKGRAQSLALDTIEDEIDNVRAAWNRALEQQNASAVGKFLDSLKLFCEMRSRYEERNDLFTRAQERFAAKHGEEPNLTWCRVVVRNVGFLQHRPDSSMLFERCLQVARAANDKPEEAYCLFALGDYALTTSDVEAAKINFEASLALYRELGDDYFIAQTLNRLGLYYLNTRQLREYFDYGAQSLELARRIGDKIGAGWALHSIGSSAYYIGDYAKGDAAFKAASEIWKEIGNSAGQVMAQSTLALSRFQEADFDTALALAEEALAIALEINYPIGKAATMNVLARAAILEEAYEQAAEIYAEIRPDVVAHATLRLWVDLGSNLVICGLDDIDKLRTAVIGSLATVAAFGFAPTMLMWNMPPIIILLAKLERYERAAELLGMMENHPARSTGWLDEWPLYTTLRDQIKSQLGTEVYAAAYERGKPFEVKATAMALREEFEKSVTV